MDIQGTRLWSHKFRGAAESAGRRGVPHVLFAKTIVGNLNVAVKREENVVEF
jgi:hypothetical protein